MYILIKWKCVNFIAIKYSIFFVPEKFLFKDFLKAGKPPYWYRLRETIAVRLDKISLCLVAPGNSWHCQKSIPPDFSSFFVPIVVKPVEFAGSVRHILFHLIQVDQEVHGEEFLRKFRLSSLMPSMASYKLQVAEWEFLGSRLKTQRVFLYLLQSFITGNQKYPGDQKPGRLRFNIMPVQFIFQYPEFMMLRIDEGTICHRNHAGSAGWRLTDPKVCTCSR